MSAVTSNPAFRSPLRIEGPKVPVGPATATFLMVVVAVLILESGNRGLIMVRLREFWDDEEGLAMMVVERKSLMAL